MHYVVLREPLWRFLYRLYGGRESVSDCCIIQRRLLRQTELNTVSIELEPLPVDIHWYLGSGYASETASDTLSVCSCGIHSTIGKCNRTLCSVGDLINRYVCIYVCIAHNIYSLCLHSSIVSKLHMDFPSYLRRTTTMNPSVCGSLLASTSGMASMMHRKEKMCVYPLFRFLARSIWLLAETAW